VYPVGVVPQMKVPAVVKARVESDALTLGIMPNIAVPAMSRLARLGRETSEVGILPPRPTFELKSADIKLVNPVANTSGIVPESWLSVKASDCRD